MRTSRKFVVVMGCTFLVIAAVGGGSGRAQSEVELKRLHQRIDELFRAGKYYEAVPLAERYVKAVQAHPAEYPTALSMLAALLQNANRPAAAEPLCRRALALLEESLGAEHPKVATALDDLGVALSALDRLDEAEPLFRRALAIDENKLGREHLDVVPVLNNLASLLQKTYRLDEAELLFRRALAIYEKRLGPTNPAVAVALSNLAMLLQSTNRLVEAEPLYRRALAIDEKRSGATHPIVATRLALLAGFLKATNRPAEAEPLYRRALAINESSLGSDHPLLAQVLGNLAGLLQAMNRSAEAETLLRRALAIDERSYGPEHPHVARRLASLASLLATTDRLLEAEPLMRRSLAIEEKSRGPEHPEFALGLTELALLLQAANRFAEAQPLLRRALAIYETNFGPEHPVVAEELSLLSQVMAASGDWSEAAALGARAVPLLTARGGDLGDRGGVAKAKLARNTAKLRLQARAVFRAGADNDASLEDGFELAQWAVQTDAADALSQMAARFAKGTGPLAALVRQRQDLIALRRSKTRRLDATAGNTDANATEGARSDLAAVDRKLDGIDVQLASEFRDYAALAHPKPLTIAATQAILGADEALVLLLDVPSPRLGKLPEETLIWVVTKEGVRWHSIPLGTRALSEQVAALRCGLDASNWDDARTRRPETADEKRRVLEQQARRARCIELLGLEVSSGDWPPFDLGRAYELYQVLFAPFSDLVGGKQLIIVPSAPLTALPFQVLITKPPEAGLVGMARYRQAAWLALQQSVMVLPAVSSLQVLRTLGPSQAPEPYIGFGNPLLVGPSGVDKRAWSKRTCGANGRPAGVAEAGGLGHGGVTLRALDLAELRLQPPLPETADELCGVAEALGALPQERDTIWLGERATERNLKRLSREGTLAHYKVLHFATHGLLPGESVAMQKAEPALVLTPPKDGTTPLELEEDDGLLTASEVAQLELDADWVVLSACNTAAGEKGNAAALSGLARAFFYAKARALLVSHWYVKADAAVKLTTKAFAELKADPNIGRAEALRRSMVELMQHGAPEDAHPAAWGPFVVVGEGGSASVVAEMATPQPIRIGEVAPTVAPQSKAVTAPAAKKSPPRSRAEPDWKGQVLGR
jgi:CHAT domain-containing protein/Tfp pilus assembly protein PilF